MRRFTLVVLALLAAACTSGAVSAPPDDASATPNRFGSTFPAPTGDPTPDTTVAPADISTWAVVAPIGQGFAVAMPGQPTVTSANVGDPPVPTTIWTYTDPNGRSYQIARSRLPKGSVPEEPETLPDGLHKRVLESLEGGSFVSRADTTVDGRPGIRYVARSGDLRSEGLLVLDEDLLYRVCMTFEPDSANEAALKAFLGSLTLTA